MNGVPVVCFGLGGERFAVASADVIELDRDDAIAEPLTALCALPATDAPTRTITVATAGWLRTFAVEAPIEVRTVRATQTWPPPTGWRSPLVVGYARLEDRWVQLLDSVALVGLGRLTPDPAATDGRRPDEEST